MKKRKALVSALVLCSLLTGCGGEKTTPVSEKGCCGGTYIDKADKNRVILSKDEQDAVSVVLDDKTQELWIRREMFSVLYRIGNPKEARNVLDRNKYILAMEGNGPEHAG